MLRGFIFSKHCFSEGVKMNYQEFIEDVVSHISESISNEKKVVVQQVTKNNGMKYDGLVILDPILNISPTIYLNPYYHRYLEGVSLEDIYSDVLTIYETYMPKEDFDISQFVDFEKAKSKIIFKGEMYYEKSFINFIYIKFKISRSHFSTNSRY